MVGETLHDSLDLMLNGNDSVREASPTGIAIHCCLVLCNNLNDAVIYLSFFSFKSCKICFIHHFVGSGPHVVTFSPNGR